MYYYFTRKKNPIPVIKPLIPATSNVPTQTNVESYVYPEGLQELDLVANGVESAQLYKGQLRPYTAAYAARYLPNSWPNTKIIPQIIYASIPRGAILDI